MPLPLAMLSAWLAPCSAVSVHLPPHTLTPLSLALPPLPPTSSLSLTVEGGRGSLQVAASLQSLLSTWSLSLAPSTRHSRPLCTSPGLTSTNTSLALTLLSPAEEAIDVELTVEETSDHVLRAGQDVQFPWRRHSVFRFSPGEEAVRDGDQFLLRIDNPGGGCLEVSTGRPDCPWTWQLGTTNILGRAFLPLNASSVVIMVRPVENQADCFNGEEDARFYSRAERDTVKLVVTRTLSSYAQPIIFMVVALLVISLPTGVGLVLFWRRKHQKEEEFKLRNKEEELPTQINDAATESVLNSLDQVDTTVDESGRNGVRRRSTQLLPELVTSFFSSQTHRFLRSDAYLHLVPLLVVFYTIPSAQLVFLTQTVDSNACSFNYGCARPWAIFRSFNHIVSNLGYVWFGLCFILIVRVKSFYFQEATVSSPSLAGLRGLPQQYGLYYAIGTALVAQGFLSAIFHICPSNLSLQFDTTMMYFIMTLVMVKVYQFRHPDTTMNAFMCLSLLGLVLVFEAFSVHLMSLSRTHVSIFTALFCLLYVIFVLWLGNAFYLNRHSRRFKSRNAIQCFSCLVLTWVHVVTVFSFILVNLLVLGTVIVSVWWKSGSLSTPLILVIGSNMFLYLGYYMARKFGEIMLRISEKEERDKERIEVIGEMKDGEFVEISETEGWVHWLARVTHLGKCEKEAGRGQEQGQEQEMEQETVEEVAKEEADSEGQCGLNMVRWLSYILFSAALLLALVAAAFYANKHQSRNLSPAQSREKNVECRFLEFYDNHDLWHFFSSLALFLALLGLLTIDDDLLLVKMDRIKVF